MNESYMNPVGQKIDEFSDYIGLNDFTSGYHYYLMNKQNIAIIYEKNYGHTHEMKKSDLIGKLKESKLLTTNGSLALYESVNDLENKSNQKHDKVLKSYILAIKPVTEEINDGYFGYLVMHLINETNIVCNLVKDKEYFIKNVFDNIFNNLFAYDNLFGIIDILTEMMEKRNKTIPYNMVNISAIATKIGIGIGLDSIELDILNIASNIHDVGKIFISDTILNKEEALTTEELDIIKEHPQRGAELVEVAFTGLEKYKQVPDIIKKHHENFDGSGYPYNLIGDQIPLLSRVIRIADTINAMYSVRAYKNKSSMNEIIKELERFKGTYYDPEIIPHAIEVLNEIAETKIVLEKNEVLMINNASLTIKDYDNNYINIYAGSFQLRNNNGKFKVRALSDFDNKVNKPINSKASIIFMQNGMLYEFQGKIYGYSDGKLFLENVKQLPLDKLFSMPWQGECSIRRNKSENYKCKIIEFGASGIILEVDNKQTFESNSLSLDEVLEISINEIVDNLNIDLLVMGKVKNVYFVNSKMQIMCSYLDLKVHDQDMIVKMLFRKQSELRRL